MDWLQLLVFPAIRALILIFVLLTGFAYLTWYERKLLARFQVRYGPNRAGKFGLLQPAADAVKAFFKEEIIPNHVDKPVYLLAPALALVPALIHLGGHSYRQGDTCHRRRKYRLSLDSGGCRNRELRHHSGGLGQQQQLFAARRAALRCADGLL